MRGVRWFGALVLPFGLLGALACATEEPTGGRGAPSTAGAGNTGATGSAGGTGGTTGGTSASEPWADPTAAGTGGTASTTPAPDVDRLLEGSCANATVESSLLPTNILFVIDRSGSMTCNPPPTTDSAACEASPQRANASEPSKWEITRDALLEAIGALPDDTRVGVSYFSNDNACGVHSTPSVTVMPLDTAQRTSLQTSLDNTSPEGGTPLVGATVLAYQHLHQAALDGTIVGNKFVVLLTDGEQSEECTDTSRCATADECTNVLLTDDVPRAAGEGVHIRTFVIGAPGSEPARAVLSEIAVEGGTAPDGCDPANGECHFDMTQNASFGSALTEALASITGKAITCELPLPTSESEAVDLDFVNVVYSPGDGSDPSIVLQDAATACDGGADGWQVAPDAKSIHLCGPICDTVRADPTARVDIVLGCPVRVE